MYNKIYHIFTLSAKGKNLMILLFAYLFMTVFLLQWSVATLMTNASLSEMLDWHLSYSVDQVYTLLKAYGSQSREWYILIELTINTLTPFIYAFLFSFSIILICNKLRVKEQVSKSVFLLPFAALLADLSENICIILMLINYPYKLAMVAKAANIFTYSKWILLMANAALIVAGIVIVGFRYIRFKVAPKSVSQ
ncbi:hypothetical protein [Rhodocytophaga aerolata]